jgi:hypothetical protein
LRDKVVDGIKGEVYDQGIVGRDAHGQEEATRETNKVANTLGR